MPKNSLECPRVSKAALGCPRMRNYAQECPKMSTRLAMVGHGISDEAKYCDKFAPGFDEVAGV
jgi:hypothetical protein